MPDRKTKLKLEQALGKKKDFAEAARLVRSLPKEEKSLDLFKNEYSLTKLLKQEYEPSQDDNGPSQDTETSNSVEEGRSGRRMATDDGLYNEDKAKSDPCKTQLNQLVLAVMDTAAECGEEEIDSVLGMTKDVRNPLSSESSCYFFISKYKIEELRKHKCLQHVAKKKWKEYGLIMQMILFLLYLVFTAILTTALALAAKTSDPRIYTDPVDWFRLFCEIITFIYTIVDLFLEGHDLYCSTKRRNWKRHQKSGKWKNCLYVVWLHLEWENILDCLAIICTLFIIPFRLAASNVQWAFSALTYIFHALRIFKFAILFESVGVYVSILLRVIKRDLPQFLLVFGVLVLAFGGGLNFALRGEETTGSSSAASNMTEVDPVDNNSSAGMNPSETSEIHITWLLGLRLLAEGSVVDYTTYKCLAIILYWLMIFTISVVLLNLLIAQFNTTYEQGTKDAEVSIALIRLGICQKLETTWWRKWAPNLCDCPGSVQTKIIDAILETWTWETHLEEDELQKDVRELKQELSELRMAVAEIKDILQK